jgi:hypothetical protein
MLIKDYFVYKLTSNLLNTKIIFMAFTQKITFKIDVSTIHPKPSPYDKPILILPTINV